MPSHPSYIISLHITEGKKRKKVTQNKWWVPESPEKPPIEKEQRMKRKHKKGNRI